MEKRTKLEDFNPIEQEILKVYWSDHCRHTTFNTHIIDIKIEGDADFKKKFKQSLEAYEAQRKLVHAEKLSQKPISLMDLATIGMKSMRKNGKLPNHVDDKIEYNAATFKTDIDGKTYRISFKNETHNSPTEVCPYDGAATALGGAVRDIMAARAFPYFGMRVTGCADPTNETTMPGKLPQKKITTEAAQGFSDYGKGLKLSTGYLREIYHDNYVAKRLEAGFVAGVVAAEHARIEEPVPGDVVVLIGGRTGRDGVGSAVASSKVQNEKSISTEGSSVPKGNPELERHIMELYRDTNFLKLVKKCNDFGAGGVSVAIGEIANSLDIYLDRVPQVEGAKLKPFEIAISESQERMAVAIAKKDLDALLKLCKKYHLEATHVADVTNSGYMKMFHNGKEVVSLERAFLDSAGETRKQKIVVTAPDKTLNPFKGKHYDSFYDQVIGTMTSLENCSQKGLNQIFDIKDEYAQGARMLVPVPNNKSIVSIATFSYDPYVSTWSPYYGGITARMDCLAKIIALGGNYKDTFLSDQEYFASPTTPEKFGAPFAALLGANDVSSAFGTVAIGGKDSMSGSYKDIDVPPTLISFGICTADIKNTADQAFKRYDSNVVLFETCDANGFPLDFETIKKKWDYFIKLRDDGKILVARAVGSGGILAEICNGGFRRSIGVKLNDDLRQDFLNTKSYGSIIAGIHPSTKLNKSLVRVIGKTVQEKAIIYGEQTVYLDEILKASEARLATVFPIKK